MEFRILGPLEVLDDGRTVDIGAAKQRALLAVLLLNANRVVSNDQLIEALWGERAPETAQKALQVYVSQLRKSLGRDRIVTRTPGYELRVESGELDLERFEGLVSAGKLLEALGLSRGRPLADFAYEPFAQSEIARLEELRLTCLEQRIEGDLGDGRHASIVGELEALVREHPLKERLRAQLMLALYRSGRQAEALDVYQAGRTLLSDELGLEPGVELKDLQRAILAQDPSLAAPGRPRPLEDAEPPLEDTPLARSTGRTREVRKTVTVLVCDVAPTRPQLDPEALRRMADRAFDELLPVLERHGATVERSIGGAVTAVFGIPTVHEDDALRATRAAIEMRERLAGLRDELETHWGAWLELRVGIGTGEVVAGADVDQPFATGEPVHSALLLQQAAQPGELLIDERSLRLVRDAVDAETVGEHIRLVSMLPLAPGHVSRFDSPMVGRERERRRLHDAFEQAVADRSCQLFTILGAPGVGKSRLVQEFVVDVAGAARIARGRCLPYGEGITFWPVLEAVRDAADLDDADSSEESLTTLIALLEGEEDAELAAHRVGEVIGLSDELSGAEEAFWAVRTLFEALARRRPLVVVFDDIHWGEATFLDLVDHVSDWARDAPVLLVCVARPELLDVRPHWGGGKLNATSVLLEPLSEAESVQLVDNLAGSVDLEESARQHIVEAASGNPLFVEEMLALLREDGRAGAAVEVPPTIQALLAARLDRLADAERSAIEAASIEGKVFHEACVAELVGSEPANVRRQLLTLVRKDLVRSDRPLFSGERAYRFRHLLIRDAAYESIPKEARAVLHERYAGWLERRAGERTLEFEEILGYHLEQAFRYRADLGRIDAAAQKLGRRAAERLGVAGRRALVRSDAPAAVNLISRAVALLRPDDPLRVDLVPSVRVMQGWSGDLGWADSVLSEAVAAGDEQLEAHAFVQRGFLRLFTEPDTNSTELIEAAERAIATFSKLDDELGLARAWRLIAQAHYLARHAGPSVEASERALHHARRAGDRFEERETVQWLGVALFLGPHPAEEAAQLCERLLEEMSGDPSLEVSVLGALSYLVAIQGRTAEAEHLVEQARRVMSELGEGWQFPALAAFFALSEHDPAGAEQALRPGYDVLKRVGERAHFCTVATLLARAAYIQGRYDEAEQLTHECEEAARPNDVECQIHWRGTRAKVLARRGDLAAAEELAREAVAFAESSDFLSTHADAMLDLAEVLLLAGRSDEARPSIEVAVRLYEQKGNVVAAARARAELERLTIG